MINTPLSKTRDKKGLMFQAGVEKTIRKQLGQHFTPDAVCDWMIALANVQPGDTVVDPACGTGAFLLRARTCLWEDNTVNSDTGKPLLIGFERDPLAASICRQQLGDPRCQIIQGDFLTHPFPVGTQVDVILGNPPYIRQEVAGSRPEDQAALSDSFQTYLTAFPHQQSLFGPRTDIYMRFLLKATTLLKPGGRLVFVLSNSWLSTQQGEKLLLFLAHHYQIHHLMEPATEAWFADAAIRPVILSLTRRNGIEPDWGKEPLRLTTLTEPLASLLPSEKACSSGPYWQQLREIVTQPTGQTRIRDIREFVCPAALVPLASRPAYLMNCPDMLARYLEEKRLAFIPLGLLAAVRYPVKTGINAFFYVDQTTIDRFGIEAEYLLPVLKSTRQTDRYQVETDQLSSFLFCCPHPTHTLKAKEHPGALSYILWGATQYAPSRQKRAHAVLWPQVASVRGRPAWHILPPPNPARLFAPRFVDRCFRFLSSTHPLAADQTFYTIHPDGEMHQDFLSGLLNSSLVSALMELNGRNNLGDGVLQFSREDIARLPVPNPTLYSPGEQLAVQQAFAALKTQAALPLPTALQQPERRLLDEAVLKPLFKEHWELVWSELAEASLSLMARRRGMAGERKRLQKENGHLLTQITAEERKESE